MFTNHSEVHYIVTSEIDEKVSPENLKGVKWKWKYKLFFIIILQEFHQ